MAGVVVNVPTAYINITGSAFMVYANRYREAAVLLTSTAANKNVFDPTTYFLFCLSLELHLKSFIWLRDQIHKEEIKNKYRHNLEKLWIDSKSRGISKFAKATELRERVIMLVGPYYRNRQLNYLDLEMIHKGYKELKAERRVLPTLDRLTNQLGKSLHQPILQASQSS